MQVYDQQLSRLGALNVNEETANGQIALKPGDVLNVGEYVITLISAT